MNIDYVVKLQYSFTQNFLSTFLCCMSERNEQNPLTQDEKMYFRMCVCVNKTRGSISLNLVHRFLVSKWWPIEIFLNDNNVELLNIFISQ